MFKGNWYHFFLEEIAGLAFSITHKNARAKIKIKPNKRSKIFDITAVLFVGSWW
ncbi:MULTISPECIES: hypothetical protein [Fischerella]|uniref:hypothetical protein n=1 Tax=Fischerella TaxID=1190 RepID=UPI000370E55C|nr:MULTISPECIES: hypothetical protein [Fischerella]MBD2430096.1 hypothetical protein [Fischerella sp. FACHB-380]